MRSRCTSGIGVVSVFFKVSTTPSPFFDWIGNDTKTIDLSLLITPEISLQNYIVGYIGSDSMPTCEKNYCWYVIEKVFDVTSEQLNALKEAG